MSGHMTPLKVMMISSEYPPETLGGLGSHVSDLATGLEREGCKVDVLAYTRNDPAREKIGGINIHRIKQGYASDVVRNASKEATMVEQVLEINKDFLGYALDQINRLEEQPDVIHCHDWFGFPAARELRESLKIPVVGTVHLLNHPFRRWWGHGIEDELIEQERRFCREVDSLITVSRSMREIVMRTHEVEGERVHAVHNGVDMKADAELSMDENEIKTLRRRYSLPGEKIILFAGRFTAQKGIASLLESAAQVIEKFGKVHYLMAGAPDSWPATQMMEKLFSQCLSLRRNVVFLGKIPRAELARLYRVADLAIVPSIYEPFGYAAIEAMIAGVPVVASNVGGLAEIIEDGETGLLVTVHESETGPHSVDVRELTEAQLKLLNDPARMKLMGARGRVRVMEEFTLEKMTARTLDVYRQTIANFNSQTHTDV
jgi:glycosyltransferase involved in cell wall biosynthesis